jgi:hypothetical protein
MANQYYSKDHYLALSNGAPDRAELGRARVAERKACELGHADAIAKFSPLTPENTMEAIAYQEERIAFHRRAMGLADK